MKVRVKYYSGRYYPQVKGLLFWGYTYRTYHSEYQIVNFDTQEKAVEYLKTDFMYDNKVVWKGETCSK